MRNSNLPVFIYKCSSNDHRRNSTYDPFKTKSKADTNEDLMMLSNHEPNMFDRKGNSD